MVSTVHGYLSWCQIVNTENHIIISEAIFTYMLALYLFRAAIRRNNSELIMASRVKLSPLFYGLNMTHYQEIHLRDVVQRVCMPESFLEFITRNESFSVSGHPNKGEGGDFILEARNRCTKMWMPPGPPTQETWLRVCRNQDGLDKVHARNKKVH